MEAPVVVMDDAFIEAYSKVFAEKATPVYQQMLNEKYQEMFNERYEVMRKYTYFAVWNGVLLGVAFTMLFTKFIMGEY